MESVKPLPKLRRELTEKELLPKGVVTQGSWQRKQARAQTWKGEK